MDGIQSANKRAEKAFSLVVTAVAIWDPNSRSDGPFKKTTWLPRPGISHLCLVQQGSAARPASPASMVNLVIILLVIWCFEICGQHKALRLGLLSHWAAARRPPRSDVQ